MSGAVFMFARGEQFEFGSVWFRLLGSYKSQPLARQLGAVQAHQHSKKNTSRDDEGRSRSLLLLLFFFF